MTKARVVEVGSVLAAGRLVRIVACVGLVAGLVVAAAVAPVPVAGASTSPTTSARSWRTQVLAVHDALFVDVDQMRRPARSCRHG